MRRVSITARTAVDATASDEVEVMLIRISHPDLEEPILVTSDPTTRISIDPPIYGTKSTWAGAVTPAEQLTYLFTFVSAMLPDDLEDQPQAATVVLEVLDHDMAAVVRSTNRRATVDMAVVLASTTDLVEAEYLGLALVSAEGDAGEIKLTISRDPITSEPWPARRMTRNVMSGLHR